MKNLVLIVVFVSFILIGCSSSLAPLHEIEITNEVKTVELYSEDCWVATGYAESTTLEMAHNTACLSGKSKMTRHLAKPATSSSSISYTYELLESKVIRQKVEKVGEYWVAKVMIAAPVSKNPKK